MATIPINKVQVSDELAEPITIRITQLTPQSRQIIDIWGIPHVTIKDRLGWKLVGLLRSLRAGADSVGGWSGAGGGHREVPAEEAAVGDNLAKPITIEITQLSDAAIRILKIRNFVNVEVVTPEEKEAQRKLEQFRKQRRELGHPIHAVHLSGPGPRNVPVAGRGLVDAGDLRAGDRLEEPLMILDGSMTILDAPGDTSVVAQQAVGLPEGSVLHAGGLEGLRDAMPLGVQTRFTQSVQIRAFIGEPGTDGNAHLPPLGQEMPFSIVTPNGILMAPAGSMWTGETLQTACEQATACGWLCLLGRAEAAMVQQYVAERPHAAGDGPLPTPPDTVDVASLTAGCSLSPGLYASNGGYVYLAHPVAAVSEEDVSTLLDLDRGSQFYASLVLQRPRKPSSPKAGPTESVRLIPDDSLVMDAIVRQSCAAGLVVALEAKQEEEPDGGDSETAGLEPGREEETDSSNPAGAVEEEETNSPKNQDPAAQKTKSQTKRQPSRSRWDLVSLLMAGLLVGSVALVVVALIGRGEEDGTPTAAPGQIEGPPSPGRAARFRKSAASGQSHRASTRPKTEPGYGRIPRLVVPSIANSGVLSPLPVDARCAITNRSAHALTAWNLETGQRRHLSGLHGKLSTATVAEDGQYVLCRSGKNIFIWDLRSGRKTGVYAAIDDSLLLESVALSDDGAVVVNSFRGGVIRTREASSGRMLHMFHLNRVEADSSDLVCNVQLSPTGQCVAAVVRQPQASLLVWATRTGKLLRSLHANADERICAVALDDDAGRIVSGSANGQIRLWGRTSRQVRHSIRAHIGQVASVALSPDGRHAVSAGQDKTIRLWDISTGKQVHSFDGHSAPLVHVAFTQNGLRVLSRDRGNVVKLWDVATGALQLTWINLDEGDWVAITPDGHFDGTERGMQLVSYETGDSSVPLSSLFDGYYTPKLVARALSGSLATPRAGDVREGISPPPSVTITSPTPGTRFETQDIRVSVTVEDQGGGIEDLRLYHNGKLIAEGNRGLKKSGSQAGDHTLRYRVRLSPGMNILQAAAFSRGRSERRSDTVRVSLKEAEATADLYVLSVGIDTYANSRYSLNFAQRDAEAIVTTLKSVGARIFGEIHVLTAFSREATRSAFLAKLSQVRSRAQPKDVFVLYYAGHGVMSEGIETPSDFYLALSDVTHLYGHDDILAAEGVSAQELKVLCTKIAAGKQLLILDACQAGGAVESFAQRGVAEDRAIRQLQRSTGIALIASAGREQSAAEAKSLGHGVFTHVLLSALNGEADGSPRDGKITTGELGSYVEDVVPVTCDEQSLEPQYPSAYTLGQNFPIAVSVATVEK
jgi:WD40 repeat protein